MFFPSWRPKPYRVVYYDDMEGSTCKWDLEYDPAVPGTLPTLAVTNLAQEVFRGERAIKLTSGSDPANPVTSEVDMNFGRPPASMKEIMSIWFCIRDAALTFTQLRWDFEWNSQNAGVNYSTHVRLRSGASAWDWQDQTPAWHELTQLGGLTIPGDAWQQLSVAIDWAKAWLLWVEVNGNREAVNAPLWTVAATTPDSHGFDFVCAVPTAAAVQEILLDDYVIHDLGSPMF